MGMFAYREPKPTPRWKVERERKARHEARMAQIEAAVDGCCGDCDGDRCDD